MVRTLNLEKHVASVLPMMIISSNVPIVIDIPMIGTKWNVWSLQNSNNNDRNNDSSNNTDANIIATELLIAMCLVLR